MFRFRAVALATLLVLSTLAARAAEPTPAKAAELPPMPAAVSSFGAAECDGYLYLYGGHAGKTHSYDTKSVLGTFHRLKLDGGTKWEELPGGPIAQGLNLAAHGGKVYRVGGMQPKNAPGEASDNHSLTDCADSTPRSASGRRWPRCRRAGRRTTWSPWATSSSWSAGGR